MKTKIRTFMGIVALGLFGLVNINATSDYKSEINAKLVSETEGSMTIESWMLENDFFSPKTKVETVESTIESWMLENEYFLPNTKVEREESEKALEVETWMTNDELFVKSAESYTAAGADREIEKYADKQVSCEKAKSRK